MALEGFTIGGGDTTGAPPVAAPTPTTGTALAGFSIGSTGAAPTKPASTTAPVAPVTPTKSASVDSLVAATQPKPTNNLFSGVSSLISEASTAIGSYFDSPDNKSTAANDTATRLNTSAQIINDSSARLTQKAATLDKTDKTAIDAYNAAIEHHNGLIGNYVKDKASSQPTPKLYKPSDFNYFPSSLAEHLPFVGGIIAEIHNEEANQIIPNLTLHDAQEVTPGVLADTGKAFIKSPIQGATELPNLLTAGQYQPQIHFTVPGLGEVNNSDFRIAEAIAKGGDPVSTVLAEKSSGLMDALFFASIIAGGFKPRLQVTSEAELSAEDYAKTPDAVKNISPKSFREYAPPSSATPLSRAFIEQAQANGGELGKNFNPELPTFFRLKFDAGTKTFRGQVVQVKPSFVDSVMNTFKGDITKAPESELQTVGAGRTTTMGQIEAGAKDATTTHPPKVLANEKGAALLHEEVNTAIATHGPDVTAQELEKTLGVDAITAGQIVRSVQAHEALTNPDSLNAEPTTAPKALQGFTVDTTPTPQVEGVNPAQTTKLSNEEAAPMAEKAAAVHYDDVQQKAIAEGRPVAIGADDMKDYFGKDYNDNNHPVYSRAAHLQYERALSEVPADTVIFTGGGPASGKTELVTKGITEGGHTGIIYDSNMANFDGAKKQIEMARDAGKQVEIHGVIPNLDKSRTFSIQRKQRIGRGISDATFARGHAGFPNVLARLLEEGLVKESEVKLLDTREAPDMKAAINMVQHDIYVEKPLEFLRKLGYTEDNLKETYAKRHYDEISGERRTEISASSKTGTPSRRNRANSGEGNGKGNERLLDKQPKDREEQAVIESLPKDIQAKAEEDWEEHYAEAALKRSDAISVLQREIKDAKKAELPALQKKLDALLKQDAAVENAFIEKWQPNAAEELIKKYEASHANHSISGLEHWAHINASDEIAEKAVALYKEQQNSGEFSVKAADTQKETTQGPGNTKVPVIEVNGERIETPTQLVTKTAFKDLINTLPGKEGVFTVVGEEHDRFMKLVSDSVHMKIRPSALGLSDTELKSGDTVRINAADLKTKGSSMRLYDNKGQMRGFVSLDPLVSALDKADDQIKDFAKKTLEPVRIGENLQQSFERLEGAAQADLETVAKLIKELDISKADDEALYLHAENPDTPLTAKQKELEEKIDAPLKAMNKALFERIKDTGMPMDDEDTYISRFPKEKPSIQQKIFRPAEGRTPTAAQGSVLSKSASSLKKRTMKALTDEEGNRTVVSIKDNRVTAFRNKEKIDLGTLKGRVTAKVTEFVDPAVRTKLEALAKDLGITHKRVPTGRSKGLGTKNAGVSITGENLIKTRMGPDSVIAHEIGHQIDDKYGMQEQMKHSKYDMQRQRELAAEMRALADARFEGVQVKDGFKQYVRKGSEKMAVMFEAYISNRDLFKEVAPHLYDDFRQFLADHDELAPFLDIKGSVQLEKRTVGGEHVAGRNGSTFIDAAGKKYTIGEATTQEIEQHTNLEYYHSAISSRLMQYLKLRQIDRAMQFLESWKDSPDFAEIAVKNDQVPPRSWKMTNQVNFRNYYFEPRTAEILDDMQRQMSAGNANWVSGVNRVLADAIFFNGLAHPINVAVTWAFSRGATSLVNPLAYASGYRAFGRALQALSEKNEDYLELLRNGAHLMSSDVTNQTVAENLARKLSDEMERHPTAFTKLLDSVGFTAQQFNFKTNIIYKISHDMAWLSNDLLTMQSIFEAMDTRGLTMQDAIKETARFIPDYRAKSRLLDKPLAVAGKLAGNTEKAGNTSRFFAQMVYNRNVAMFGSYHVGLIESLSNAIGDTAKGADWKFTKENMAARGRGADKLLMLALLGLVVYPWLDKKAQEAFGPTSYVTRSGITKYPYLAYKMVTGQTDLSQGAQQVVTPAIGTWQFAQQFVGRDFFTGNALDGPGGEGRLNLLLNAVAPFAAFQQVAKGKLSPGGFGATLIGVHTPANNKTGLDLNAMIYTEKPQVLKAVKQHIVSGDTAGATQLAHDFNVRLADQIKIADIAGGNSGSPARVAYFLNQYGLRMPGEVALTNFKAKQGQNIVQKTLPNGKPVIVKNTPVPQTGVIGAITTYAKAIGTDPVTAFKDIFTGQTIRNVENGAIIVNRMSLADSQAVKKAGGGNNPDFKLDHIVPLEGGGDNGNDNLQLIPTAQWQSNTDVENFIGTHLKAGDMTPAQAREISIRFKAGQGEILSPALVKEYTEKYGGKPLTQAEAYDYTHSLHMQ